MTEPIYLDEIRTSYDNVAAAYAGLVPPLLGNLPLSKAMLNAFAELVLTGGGAGPVADVGCGPGHVTSYLASRGVDAFGIDLSPGMVEMARRDHPALRFEVGTMTALDIADASLGGLLAWYSIIHLPLEALPIAFAEFHRALAPGGFLMLGFHVGDERRRKTEGYGGLPMSLDLHLLPIDRITGLATAAGLEVQARLTEPPAAGSRAGHACLLFWKPTAP